MGTRSKITFVTAAFVVSAALGFGKMDCFAACPEQPISDQASVLNLDAPDPLIQSSLTPLSQGKIQTASQNFEPEPNAPPEGTGGTGTR